MSHGDRVTELAPGFEVYGTSPNAPFAIIGDPARRFYGVQFHPEVHHTVHGARPAAELHRHRRLHRRLDHGRLPRPGDRRASATRSATPSVICGLSGGVDSLRRRRPDPRGHRRPAHLRLRRHRPDAPRRGRRRSSTSSATTTTSRLIHADEGDRFLDALDGVEDPEAKRKTIGRLFIDVFERARAGGRRRQLPRPGHPLPRRHRERQLLRRPRRSPSRATTTSAASPSACT